MAKRAMAEKVTELVTIADHAKVSTVAAINYATF
jgi:DeoR/GlpR family transcriptional regulator of sugar metabolism